MKLVRSFSAVVTLCAYVGSSNVDSNESNKTTIKPFQSTNRECKDQSSSYRIDSSASDIAFMECASSNALADLKNFNVERPQRGALRNKLMRYEFAESNVSDDSIISQFIQSIPSTTPHKDLCKIKSRAAKNAQRVAKALWKGVPYNLMAEMLLKKCNAWIFKLYPQVFENENVSRLFIELSRHRYESIPKGAVSELADIRQFLINLSDIPDKRLAMNKLVLMIYFPEHAQFISDCSHPVHVFKTLVLAKLTGWRRAIVEKVDWENDQMEQVPLFKCHFKFTKNYYEGYKEGSMFDDFIETLNEPTRHELWNKLIATTAGPLNFFRKYRRNIVEREFQGTIYSVIRDKHKLEWGPIDPLSTEINPKFEDDCMNILLQEYSPSDLWLRSKYINITSGSSISLSRLIFNPKYSTDSFVGDYCSSDQRQSARAIHEIYNSLANYCQSRGEYLKKWDSDANAVSSTLFKEIWEHNMEHCDFLKGFEIMMMALEDAQVDSLTKKLLLQMLKEIVATHFSTSVASDLGFDDWTNTLKNQLSKILDNFRVANTTMYVPVGKNDGGGRCIIA